MEENVAILMADLSGYTALTETHGSGSAADLIEKYIEIATKCLVGDCKIHQCIGDEIMIVSSSPDFLLATTILIAETTSREEYFLQLHGGLHFGKVLKRGDNYFGSAVNLTARITAKAGIGAFWCSDDFLNALSDKSGCMFESQGNHSFKNVSKETEVFELDIRNKSTFYIDPVCRMLILDTKTAVSHPTEEGLFFCSSDCLNTHTENS